MFSIGAGAFSPPPKVESAFVRLMPHLAAPFPLGDPVRFAALVNQAFSRRRKTLRNALQGLADEAAIRAAGRTLLFAPKPSAPPITPALPGERKTGSHATLPYTYQIACSEGRP